MYPASLELTPRIRRVKFTLPAGRPAAGQQSRRRFCKRRDFKRRDAEAPRATQKTQRSAHREIQLTGKHRDVYSKGCNEPPPENRRGNDGSEESTGRDQGRHGQGRRGAARE